MMIFSDFHLLPPINLEKNTLAVHISEFNTDVELAASTLFSLLSFTNMYVLRSGQSYQTGIFFSQINKFLNKNFKTEIMVVI